MLGIFLALAQAVAAPPPAAFDLRSAKTPGEDSGEIIVTSRRDSDRFRTREPVVVATPPPPISIKLPGNAKAAFQTKQGRMGDGQVGVGITIPF